MSFNYIILKSSKKYLRVRCVDRTCGGLCAHVLSENRIGFTSTSTWESILVALIMSRESTRMSPWRVDEESGRFIYYFMVFGASIRGYAHMRKAYTLEEFNDYFNAFKERCPSAVACLEHEVGFEKWSRAHFPGNRFNVMTSNIAESLNSILCDERQYPVEAIFNSNAHRFREIFRKRYAEVDNSKTTFVPVVETILRENMIEGDKLYVNNINESTDEFTVLGYGRYAKVNLSRRSCSCRNYNLVKLSCAHAMAALRLKNGDEYGTSIYN
ncbi:hypothetical protein BC332_32858 [Capsicum chinense]|nr:hypothetical protein BC332_32858 [Capsicum chinense]